MSEEADYRVAINWSEPGIDIDVNFITTTRLSSSAPVVTAVHAAKAIADSIKARAEP